MPNSFSATKSARRVKPEDRRRTLRQARTQNTSNQMVNRYVSRLLNPLKAQPKKKKPEKTRFNTAFDSFCFCFRFGFVKEVSLLAYSVCLLETRTASERVFFPSERERKRDHGRSRKWPTKRRLMGSSCTPKAELHMPCDRRVN